MSTTGNDIPLDKAELLSVLLEALLYGKSVNDESWAKHTEHSWAKVSRCLCLEERSGHCRLNGPLAH